MKNVENPGVLSIKMPDSLKTRWEEYAKHVPGNKADAFETLIDAVEREAVKEQLPAIADIQRAFSGVITMLSGEFRRSQSRRDEVEKELQEVKVKASVDASSLFKRVNELEKSLSEKDERLKSAEATATAAVGLQEIVNTLQASIRTKERLEEEIAKIRLEKDTVQAKLLSLLSSPSSLGGKNDV